MAEIKRDDNYKVMPVEEEHHVGMVRRTAMECARSMGFSEIDTILIVTSALELARNILVHAGKGKVIFRRVSMGAQRGLEIVFVDQGPGIEDTERSLRDGYSTSGSLGVGLSGVKRMMDELEIESELGKGTAIWTRKWL